MVKFDLVLVFSAPQRNCIFLEIIQKLSKKKSILVYPVVPSKNQVIRLAQTSQKFLAKCEALGAKVGGYEEVSCKLMIIGQRDFQLIEIQNLKKNITAQKVAWLSGLAMGNAQYENLYGLKVDYVFIPDLNFYRHRLSEFSTNGIKFLDEKLVEIGMPKFSVFDECFKSKRVDYLIAHPTPFSFSDEYDAYHYYKRLHTLVKALLSQRRTVVIKNHNADERGNYLINKNLKLFVRLLFWVKIEDKFLRAVDWMLHIGSSNKSKFVRLLVASSINVLDRKILRECAQLSDLTSHHGMNLELFLPYVQKGLITGRSNSIWHGLFHKIPVVNLVDADTPYKHEDKMHKVAMQYLDVHFSGHLEFNSTQFQVISERTRKANITRVIKKILGSEN